MIECFTQLCKRVSSPRFMISQMSCLKKLADVTTLVEAEVIRLSLNIIGSSITFQRCGTLETCTGLFDIQDRLEGIQPYSILTFSLAVDCMLGRHLCNLTTDKLEENIGKL